MSSKLTLHYMMTEQISSYLLDQIKYCMEMTDKNPVIIGIPGGRTAAYIIQALENLSDAQLSRLQLILVDERLSGQTNYETLLESGLQKLITSGRMSPGQTSAPESFRMTDLPVFDLLLLGVGEDGHFASLFPSSFPDLDTADTPEISVINDSPKPPSERITITYRGFRNCCKTAQVILIVTGTQKKQVLERILSYENPSQLPCAFLPEVLGSAEIVTDIPYET